MKLYLKRSKVDDSLPQLGELIDLMPDLNWSVLFASGAGYHLKPSEWQEIRILPRGLLLSSSELAQFDIPDEEDNSELIEALIVGAFDSLALIRYENHDEMYARCDVVLDLADGDSWLITAKDTRLLETIAEAFRDNDPTFH